ncbi:MAG: type II toxin-antitoxin system MqsA family antitoxin [Acidobacteriota bacterium]|nr:type II toxin-antitoxin system MqsA family antitoxin [Acidobacteriota bacterium]
MPNKKTESESISELLVCGICGHQAARPIKRPQVLGKGAAMLIIEDVPAISCRHCGEIYLTAETMHRLDELRRSQKTLPRRYHVPVAAFA